MQKIYSDIITIIVSMGADACKKQLMALKRDLRVFVLMVLNGGEPQDVDKIRALLGERGHCIVLPENLGGSGGFRAGMQYVIDSGCPDTQKVWLLDDDAEINDHTLSGLLDAAGELEKRGTRWGAIGSMMVDANHRSTVVETGASVDWKRGGFRQNNKGKSIVEISTEIQPVQYCAAASLLTYAGILRKVGIFANVFLHFDDVDWSFRLTKKNYGIYCAPASYFHHPTGLNKPATWVRYYDAANYIWLCRTHNRKQLLPAIVQQCIKGFYFHLHGLHKTGNLYFSGIQDGLRGDRRKLRDELSYEKYSPVSAGSWPEARCFISMSKRNMVSYRKKYPEGTFFFFLGTGIFSRISRGIILNIWLFFKNYPNVIIDDGFRNRIILPLFFQSCDYYNVILNQKVVL